MPNYDIKGFYDLHVHAGPDVKPRKINYLELIQAAVESQMGGMVIKNHYFPTSCEAALLQIQFPQIKIYGGVTLNYSLGGLNVHAVEKNIEMGGKLVWMPTHDSLHEKKYHKQEGGISILLDGKLRKEAMDIVDLIASKNVVLGSGHLSFQEIIELLKYASGVKLQKIIVNHPGIIFQRFSVEQQMEMIRYGAFVEHSYCRPPHTLPVEEFCRQIKELGPSNVVVGTDLGQPSNPHPVEGMLETIQHLIDFGFSRTEVENMVCENPKYLLNE